MSTAITAAVTRRTGQPSAVEELQVDDLRPDGVRARTVATGVYPTHIPAGRGHERAGVVEAVRTVRAGDHATLSPAHCRTCRRRRDGRMSYYKNLFREDLGGHRRDGSTSLSDDNGPASSHFFGQSSFATYANVVETSVVKIDLSVPLEVVAPLGCDLQTGAGAVLKDVQRRPGSSLAVFGVGAVGSAALIAVRVAGCTTIVALDVYDSRLEPATEFGAPR